MNPLAQRLVSTLVTSFLLWFFGVLAAKAPALNDIAQNLVDAAGGMTVVSLGIAGAIVVGAIALYIRIKGYWKLHVASKLPTGTTPAEVDLIYKSASYGDVLHMRIPTTAKAATMLAAQRPPKYK